MMLVRIKIDLKGGNCVKVLDDGSKVIWETENFIVVVPPKPFISREEGGHIIIQGNKDKYRYDSRLDFNRKEVLEIQRLCQVVVNAYINAMKKRGIDIVRINYFEAGNCAYKNEYKDLVGIKPFYHEHIFGRTMTAKKQVFPDAPYLPDRKSGFYDDFKPLNDDDIRCIVDEIKKEETKEKYNRPVREGMIVI